MWPISLALLLLMLCFVLILSQSYQRYQDEKIMALQTSILAELAIDLENHAEIMEVALDYLTDEIELHEALRAGDAARLLKDWGPRYRSLKEEHGITHFYFITVDHKCLLRLHRPEKSGDVIDRSTLFAAEQTGEKASGVEVGPLGQMVLRVVKPVIVEGELIGYVELGEEISHIMQDRQIQSGSQLAVVVPKSEIERSEWEAGMAALGRPPEWEALPDSLVSFSSWEEALPDAIAAIAAEGAATPTAVDANFDGKAWSVAVVPFTNATGQKVGDLILALDITEKKQLFGQQLILIGAGGSALLAALLGLVFFLLRASDAKILAQNAALHNYNNRLHRSEERFKALFYHTPIAISIYDPVSGALLDANPATWRMFGCSSLEDFRALDYWREPPHSLADVQALTERALRDGPQRFEWLGRKRGGEDLWNDVSLAKLVLDGEARVVATSIDITERKAAEEEIRKLSVAVEQSPASVVITDLDAKIEYVNAKFVAVTGYSRTEVLGQNPRVLKSDQTNPAVYQELWQTLRGGQEWRGEFLNKKKNGELYWELAYISPIIGEDGRTTHYLAVKEDITERKNFEVTLTAQSHLQKILMHIAAKYINMPLAELEAAIPASLGELGEFVGADRVHVFDFDFEAQLCRNTHEWCRPEVEPLFEALREIPLFQVPELVEHNLRGEDMIVVDLQSYPEDSAMRHVFEPQGIKSLITVPMMDGETCLGSVGFDFIREKHGFSRGERQLLAVFANVLVNVRQRQMVEAKLHRAMQAAKSANVAKSEFLAKMSHEIRTPMNAILGFSELLEMDNDLAPQHMEYVRIINSSGEHLLNLINDILDMSKIEANQVTVNLTNFNLRDLLDGVEALFHHLVENKGLAFKIEMEDLSTVSIRADENKLRQVLVNLVGNAVKFTHSGSIALRARLVDEKPDTSEVGQGATLSLEVEDSGIGIAPEDIGRIFQAFQQSPSGERLGGTGLGLAISQRLIEMMGGKLSVRSQINQGSCFSFRIPVEIQSGVGMGTVMGQLPKLRCGAGQVPGMEALRILIADDDKVNRMYLRALLQKVGFVVAEAVDGQEAIDLFDSWQPDAVLMDIQMPVVDGYEAIARIKSRERGRATPVIAVTADAFADVEMAVKDCGADAYVSKPFKAEELFAVLGEWLSLDLLASGGAPEEKNIRGADESRLLEGLAQFPPEQIEALIRAVEAGEMMQIKQLVAEISVTDYLVGKVLSDLAQRYDYGRLLDLFKKNSRD
jgi:PAS domain S-box-containing protein